jgi:hypothetical protein
MNPHRLILSLVLSLCAIGVPSLQAALPDLSGAWKWNFERDGETREILMKIKQEDTKVTGTVRGPDGNEVEIRDGRIAEDGKLTFVLNIERDGNTMKINFDGMASADTITGKTKYINAQGEEREREWVAKRDAKKAAHDLTGEWKSSFKRQDGTSMESVLQLKHDGEKLTGKFVSANGTETEIQDGKVQANDVSFRMLRDREGRTVTSKYRGKILENNSIKGQIDSDWTGEVRRMEWEAKRAK